MMNFKELAIKSAEELEKLAAETRAEIRDLRFKVATRQHGKVRSLRHAKRDLGRILTAKNAHPSSTK